MTEPGTRFARLLSIVLLLQQRNAVSARELAVHLGVSVRTVYRDVDVLSGMGVPVYAETGRGGGYRLIDGYRTTLTGLTGQESLALFLIGLPVPAASLGLSEPARTAEAKLLAALSPAHREQARRLRDWFLLDLPPWYQDAEVPAALPALADAVLTSRRVRVRYRRWDEPREVRRLLDPYGLVVKNGIWYLAAARGSRSGLRAYRVSNILDLQPAGQTFERRPGFDLAQFWHGYLADFERTRITDVARLRVSPKLIARLSDVGDAALRTAAAAGAVDHTGWTVLDYPIESPAWAATQLIRYGGDIQVLHPADVRDALRQLAAAVLRRHPPATSRRSPDAGSSN